MGAAVISCADAPPIFEPSEHVFDFVALLVEEGVAGDGDLPIGFRRNADGDTALCEGGAEPIPTCGLQEIPVRETWTMMTISEVCPIASPLRGRKSGKPSLTKLMLLCGLLRDHRRLRP